jgi:hypothetical protein
VDISGGSHICDLSAFPCFLDIFLYIDGWKSSKKALATVLDFPHRWNSKKTSLSLTQRDFVPPHRSRLSLFATFSSQVEISGW